MFSKALVRGVSKMCAPLRLYADNNVRAYKDFNRVHRREGRAIHPDIDMTLGSFAGAKDRTIILSMSQNC